MRFISRHSKRDMELPRKRHELLNRIITSLRTNEDVEGIFLGGSLAKGNEDHFSDIDLRIIVPDEQYKRFIFDKQKLSAQFGNVLFFEDLNPNAPFTIAHYDQFIKLDLFIYTFQTLKPSVWLKGIKVVHDPSGELQEIVRQSEGLFYQVTREEVEAWSGKVYAYIHEVYRRVMREEYYYALTMISNLRSFIVKGWSMEVDRQPNDAWDWSKIEGSRSNLEPWQLSMLGRWSCGRDQEEIMKTLHSMIPELRRLHGNLCDKIGFGENHNNFDKIVNLVL
ncbi:nucleotidyltransferase domain-containing protein [Paenibacillus antri]|nr:nucleotidyltransferase domain-containing protein [Paenibacillus antri]